MSTLTHPVNQVGNHHSPMPRATLSYRPEIDGMRAVAIIAVVAYHAGIKWVGGGFVGVDVFFVLSGYLIGFIIYSDVKASRFTFGRFYSRRAKRILPGLLAVIGLLYIPVVVLMTPSELATYARSALAALFAFSNVQFWQSITYFSPNAEWNPMLMTWSLGVEEQFYLVFPIVLLLLRGASTKTILRVLGSLVCLSFAISVWCVEKHPSVGFYLLPARAWELGLGAILAVWHAEDFTSGRAATAFETRALPLIGVVCIGASVFGFDGQMGFPGWIALVPTVGAVSLIASRSRLVTAILGSRIPVFVGKISYSWYLWHWPLLSLARLSSSGPLSPGATAAVVMLSFLLSVLSWRFIEQPFRRSERPPHQLLPRYAAAMLVVAVPAIALVIAQGWPRRFDRSVADIESFVQDRMAEPCLNDYGVTSVATDRRCRVSGIGPDSIVLLGDSHAAALSPAVRELALNHGLGFRQITKSSCPPLEVVTRWMPARPAHASECALFNQQAVASVVNDRSIKVVIVAANWSAPMREASDGSRYAPVDDPSRAISEQASEANLKIGLTNLTRDLRSAGKLVVLVEDNPILDFDPVRLTLAQKIPARREFGRLLSTDPENAPGRSGIVHVINSGDVSGSIVREVQVATAGVGLVDPFQSLCTKTDCAFSGIGGLYYFDSQHLSPRGAAIALRSLRISTPIE
jgi:peptidoglycan/LPS O-acetylase OafA/YrhL